MKKNVGLVKTQKERVHNNIDSFNEILDNSSLSNVDKNNIRYIFEYFKGKHNPKLASRSFLFYGDPGLGKTFLAEELLKAINCEVLYMGCETFNDGFWVKHEEFENLVSDANNDKKQII